MEVNVKLGYQSLYDDYGYYIDKVPKDILNELKIPINELKNDFKLGTPYNSELAGEIKQEYTIPFPPKFQSYLKELVSKTEKESNYMKVFFPNSSRLAFDSLWVNFQRKYEYQPLHFHSGIWSFVVWYQIPYTREEEVQYSAKHKVATEKIQRPIQSGNFSFIYSKMVSPIEQTRVELDLIIDKSKEGYIAMFPSTLEHIVYPFYTSDEYRITVAGNIKTY